MSQEGIDLEHLVVDAGSTDETVSILKEFPHLKWVSEPDKGMSDGINKGFTKAVGDWVMWLNADDYLLPGALERVARFAQTHPEADVIYGGWNFVDEKKTFRKKMKLFPFDLKMMIHYGTYIGSTACFFRRSSVIEEGFLLNPNFRFNMDGEYYSRLGKAGKKFIYFPEVLAEFRIHGENTSFKYLSMSGINAILNRQLQLAEVQAIRRAYGIALPGHPIVESVMDSVLCFYYRFKKIGVKILNRSY